MTQGEDTSRVAISGMLSRGLLGTNGARQSLWRGGVRYLVDHESHYRCLLHWKGQAKRTGHCASGAVVGYRVQADGSVKAFHHDITSEFFALTAVRCALTPLEE
jgi:hypothetical protein